MIRPWYRSRLFWLGLPGLVFLLWIWLGLIRQDLFVSWSRGGFVEGETRYSLSSWDGALWISQRTNRRVSISSEFEPGFGFGREELLEPDESARYFPPPLSYFDLDGQFGISSGWEAFLAWWFLILLYLFIWLGTLFVWQRRKFRLMNRQSMPPS